MTERDAERLAEWALWREEEAVRRAPPELKSTARLWLALRRGDTAQVPRSRARRRDAACPISTG
jgi:hypothetical protein